MNCVCNAADHFLLAFFSGFKPVNGLASLFEIANSGCGTASSNGIRAGEHGFELDELLLAAVIACERTALSR